MDYKVLKFFISKLHELDEMGVDTDKTSLSDKDVKKLENLINDAKYDNDENAQTLRTMDLNKLLRFFGEYSDAINDQIALYEKYEVEDHHRADKLVTPDGIMLSQHTFVHGISFNFDRLKSIKENGILAGEYFGEGDIPQSDATPAMADFWKIPKDVNAVDYIDHILGRRAGKKTIPATQLDGSVQTLTNSRESTFLKPFKNSVIFIVDADAAKAFSKYDIIGNPDSDKSTASLINQTDLQAYSQDGQSGILVGMPYSCISAVMVGTDIVKDPAKMQQIIDLFGEDLLIMSGDCKVLSVPPKLKDKIDIDQVNAQIDGYKDKVVERARVKASDSTTLSRLEPLLGSQRIQKYKDRRIF